jgi:hypothetical protein
LDVVRQAVEAKVGQADGGEEERHDTGQVEQFGGEVGEVGEQQKLAKGKTKG